MKITLWSDQWILTTKAAVDKTISTQGQWLACCGAFDCIADCLQQQMMLAQLSWNWKCSNLTLFSLSQFCHLLFSRSKVICSLQQECESPEGAQKNVKSKRGRPVAAFSLGFNTYSCSSDQFKNSCMMLKKCNWYTQSLILIKANYWTTNKNESEHESMRICINTDDGSPFHITSEDTLKLNTAWWFKDDKHYKCLMPDWLELVSWSPKQHDRITAHISSGFVVAQQPFFPPHADSRVVFGNMMTYVGWTLSNRLYFCMTVYITRLVFQPWAISYFTL